MVSCSAQVSTRITKGYGRLGSQTEVTVLKQTDKVPKDADFLGTVRVGDSGFSTKCSYDIVIGHVKTEARKIGGDLIKITSHYPPSFFGSSCHQIAANIYKKGALVKPPEPKKKEIAVEEQYGEDYVVLDRNTHRSTQTNLKNDNKDQADYEYSKIRFSLGGGFSYLTAPSSPNLSSQEKSFLQELRSGYNINTDFHYFLVEHLGVGAKYTIFRTKSEADNMPITTSNGQTTGWLENNISLNYFGPSIMSCFAFGQNNMSKVIFGFSLGYVNYNNNMVLGTEPIEVSANSFGTFLEVGLDQMLNDRIALGIKLSLSNTVLTEINQKQKLSGTTINIKLEEKEFINLSRIELTAGLRIYR